MYPTLSSEVLKEEITLVRKILYKWLEKLDSVGVPGKDIQASEENIEAFVREMQAELFVCGDTCHSIATRLFDEEA